MPSGAGLLTRVATLETKVTALETELREQAKDIRALSDARFGGRPGTRARRRRKR